MKGFFLNNVNFQPEKQIFKNWGFLINKANGLNELNFYKTKNKGENLNLFVLEIKSNF